MIQIQKDLETGDFLFRPSSIRRKRNSGQSIIEFLVSFTVVFGILTIYITIGLNSTAGFLTHYATYMSSRAYLTFDDHNPDSRNDKNAEAFAKDVFRFYDQKKELAFTHPPSTTQGGTIPAYIGVYTDFDQNFSLVPGFAGKIIMPLRSESFLGREPSRIYCLQRIMLMYSNTGWVTNVSDEGEGQTDQLNITVEDNGC